MSKMARLIDAEELLAKHTCDVYGAYDDSCMVQAVFVPYIKGAPTVDAVPVVHGHWTSLTDCSNAGVYCSVCQKKVYKEDYAWANRKNKLRSKFCPNCGARMDLEVE